MTVPAAEPLEQQAGALAERVVAAALAVQSAGGDATVAVAESLTAGLVAGTLASVPGVSAVLRGGVVVYATDLKASLIGVDAGLLDRGGAVQAEVARQMAVGVAERLGAAYGLATTGVAGPDSQDGQPAGTVYVAVHGPEGTTVAERVGAEAIPGDRSGVRWGAVIHALELWSAALDGDPGRTGPARRLTPS